MARIICDYCGTEYDDTMQRCPLCGTMNDAVAEEAAETPAGAEPRQARQRKKGKTGAHEAPNEDRIPKWLSVLICVVLGIAVVVGALYAMYALGMFTPNKKPADDTSLTLPITDDDGEKQGAEQDPAEEEKDPPSQQPKDLSCTGITLKPASVSLGAAGISASVTADVKPAGCTDPVTWTTSDPAVCTVDESGVITSVDGGTATVTAACGAFSASVEVECAFANSKENNAALSLTDFTLREFGEQATITVQNAPAGASVTWTSGNPNVCTVSNGTVTAVKSGTTTVTADVNGKKLECIVRCNIPGSVVATDDNAEVVGSYRLDHDDVTLAVGERFEISVVGGVSGGWSVTDGSVISVDGGGNVTALASGSAEVYTTVGGQRLSCIVRVK